MPLLRSAWERAKGYKKVKLIQVPNQFPQIDSLGNLRLASKDTYTQEFFAGQNRIALVHGYHASLSLDRNAPVPHIQIPSVELKKDKMYGNYGTECWAYFIPNRFNAVFTDYNDFFQEIERYLDLKLKVYEAMLEYYKEVFNYNIRMAREHGSGYLKAGFRHYGGFRQAIVTEENETSLLKGVEWVVERNMGELQLFRNSYWWVKAKRSKLLFQSTDRYGYITEPRLGHERTLRFEGTSQYHICFSAISFELAKA